jgi:hypothetical protein
MRLITMRNGGASSCDPNRPLSPCNAIKQNIIKRASLYMTVKWSKNQLNGSHISGGYKGIC